MDRMPPSEGGGAGSIPAGDIVSLKTKHPRCADVLFYPIIPQYPYFPRLIRAERRDLVRAALFFLITPLFAALSIAE